MKDGCLSAKSKLIESRCCIHVSAVFKKNFCTCHMVKLCANMKKCGLVKRCVCTTKRILFCNKLFVVDNKLAELFRIVSKNRKQGFVFKLQTMINKSFYTFFESRATGIFTCEFIDQRFISERIIWTDTIFETLFNAIDVMGFN